MELKGKLVVIEGTDGSGKGTQLTSIQDICNQRGVSFSVIDFPRYGQNIGATEVSAYLKGARGDMKVLDPRYPAMLYALDRLISAPLITGPLREGKLVIANRYTTSNMAFGAAKLPPEQWGEFIEWVKLVEYGSKILPREDLVLLMDVKPDVSQKNVDLKGKREYLDNQETRDIHEADLDYQTTVANVYRYLANTESHWRKIDCMQGQTMLPKVAITAKVVKVLEEEGIIPRINHK